MCSSNDVQFFIENQGFFRPVVVEMYPKIQNVTLLASTLALAKMQKRQRVTCNEIQVPAFLAVVYSIVN